MGKKKASRADQYFIVPTWLLIEGLTTNQIGAYLTLAGFSDRTGTKSNAGATAVQKHCGIGFNKARRILASLEEMNVIEAKGEGYNLLKSSGLWEAIEQGNDEEVIYIPALIFQSKSKRPLKELVLCKDPNLIRSMLIVWHKVDWEEGGVLSPYFYRREFVQVDYDVSHNAAFHTWFRTQTYLDGGHINYWLHNYFERLEGMGLIYYVDQVWAGDFQLSSVARTIGGETHDCNTPKEISLCSEHLADLYTRDEFARQHGEESSGQDAFGKAINAKGTAYKFKYPSEDCFVVSCVRPRYRARTKRIKNWWGCYQEKQKAWYRFQDYDYDALKKFFCPGSTHEDSEDTPHASVKQNTIDFTEDIEPTEPTEEHETIVEFDPADVLPWHSRNTITGA